MVVVISLQNNRLNSFFLISKSIPKNSLQRFSLKIPETAIIEHNK